MEEEGEDLHIKHCKMENKNKLKSYHNSKLGPCVLDLGKKFYRSLILCLVLLTVGTNNCRMIRIVLPWLLRTFCCEIACGKRKGRIAPVTAVKVPHSSKPLYAVFLIKMIDEGKRSVR